MFQFHPLARHPAQPFLAVLSCRFGLFMNTRPCFAIHLVAYAACIAWLTGCSTVGKFGEGMGNMADKTLETIGFNKPESAKPPRHVRLRVTASESLNLDPQGRSLSLVVRVYKLRAPTAFLNAPFDAFGDLAKEKQVLGEDLIDVKELVLAPGFKREIDEKWSREATHIGVIGLFMAPAPQRWRYAFDVAEFDDQSFSVGAHACALSVGTGTPIGLSQAAMRMRPTDCAPAGSLLNPPPLSSTPLSQ